MKNIDDIVEKVEKREKQLQGLVVKDKENYDLWVGKEQEFDTHKMAVNITGTEMTALTRKVQASLMRQRVDIRVHVPNPLPNDKAKDTAEREQDMFYFGLKEADERLVARGEAPLLTGTTWQVTNLGRICCRILVYYDKKTRKVVWDIRPLIPSLVTFEFDEDGLAWYRYQTFRNPASIKREYGKEVTEDTEGKGVSVSDYWDREHNVRYLTKAKEKLSFKVGEKMVTEWEHKLEEVPAIILPITLGPRAITDEGVDVTTWGQSIMDHVKIPFRNLNKLRTIVATQAHLNAKAPLDVAYETESALEAEHFDYYAGAILKHPKTETITPLKVSDVPPSILTMMGDISTGIQRATYTELSPDVSGHSGSALKILRQDMQDVLYPRRDAINRLYTEICRMAKRQILARKLTIPVRTVVNDNYEIYDMKPKLLDNDFYVEAKFIGQDAYDEVEALQEAQLLQDNKWQSRETIMEKKLLLDDVPTELTKIDKDDLEAAIPEAKIRGYIRKLRIRFDDLMEQEIMDQDLADEIKMYEEQLAMLTLEKQQSLQNARPQPAPPRSQGAR